MNATGLPKTLPDVDCATLRQGPVRARGFGGRRLWWTWTNRPTRRRLLLATGCAMLCDEPVVLLNHRLETPHQVLVLGLACSELLRRHLPRVLPHRLLLPEPKIARWMSWTSP